MTRFAGGAGVVFVLFLVLLFARWNGGERVTLELGFWTFYRIPLTYVAFGALFIGMLVMLVAGLHADLRVRRFLRERLEEEDRKERRKVDRLQQDLFGQEMAARGAAQDSPAAAGAASAFSSPRERPAVPRDRPAVPRDGPAVSPDRPAVSPDEPVAPRDPPTAPLEEPPVAPRPWTSHEPHRADHPSQEAPPDRDDSVP